MAEDYLSMDSPLGKSLLGKRLDEQITVLLPSGPCILEITEIRYGPRP
jgi:transcription elongation GreA/GreB family factor